MKSSALITGIAVIVLNGLALVPALQPYFPYLLAGSLAFALWLVARTVAAGKQAPSSTAPPVPEKTKAPAPPPSAQQAEAEILTLLGLMQEKGRLIDFLMDDITAYSDAQVGAAARVVHQGCRTVLQEHFYIEPVSAEKEGSRVTVPTDKQGDTYRLIGKIQGEPPFTGTLVHKGWKSDRVKLPRILQRDENRLPVIAPAQVELK